MPSRHSISNEESISYDDSRRQMDLESSSTFASGDVLSTSALTAADSSGNTSQSVPICAANIAASQSPPILLTDEIFSMDGVASALSQLARDRIDSVNARIHQVHKIII